MASAIGRNIRAVRRQAGYSQARLAVLSHTSQSWISRIETGDENPTLERVVEIARALRVEVADLLREPPVQVPCDEP
jgi:transcriptional regulator with XRE-family HTH domain